MHNRLPLILSALALTFSLTGAGAIAASKINGSSIANHSITASKLTRQAISQLHGAQGDVGDSGPSGDSGPQGLPGASGGFDPSKVTYVTGPTSSIYPGQTLLISAVCAPGSKVVSGGYFASINDVGASEPDAYSGTQWAVIVQNNTSIIVSSWAYAVCVAP